MKRLFLLCLLGMLTISSLHAANVVPQPPNINAENYLLIDAASGQILAEENVDERINPASITKIMTSYVVADSIAKGRISLDDEVFISDNAYQAEGSTTYLEINTRVKLIDLLRGLIIQSGNDAAIALAEHVAGNEEAFASLMNEYAKELGLNNTNYRNSTGYTDDMHYTTARDIATLSKALINDFPVHYAMYKEKEFTYNNIKQSNRNNLLWRDDSIDGIKTGHTEAAGYCLAASAKKKGMRLITVVLGTNSAKARINASQTLLNYGFSFFEAKTLYSPGQTIFEQRVWKAEQENVGLSSKHAVAVTIPRGRYQDLKISSNIPAQIIAPLSKDSVVGNLEISLDNKIIASAHLYPVSDIEQAGIFKRAIDSMKLWFAD
ncbi:MAG: D-alanyl-D-alanine carboxypeptidase [Gammaproteobacteria bacterium]|nr:D-alanyl-D-alanine carboxypeptidase [Gammaproteobacteria bacterium]NNC96894.1 D-alanyl-D-alanine carboxypeptidase [Gammaproteobacteria bacterium]NNM13309.1 D-alanyl-D-alanine carboxypeptidase [Gammaproteobacteria bacterium]